MIVTLLCRRDFFSKVTWYMTQHNVLLFEFQLLDLRARIICHFAVACPVCSLVMFTKTSLSLSLSPTSRVYYDMQYFVSIIELYSSYQHSLPSSSWCCLNTSSDCVSCLLWWAECLHTAMAWISKTEIEPSVIRNNPSATDCIPCTEANEKMMTSNQTLNNGWTDRKQRWLMQHTETDIETGMWQIRQIGLLHSQNPKVTIQTLLQFHLPTVGVLVKETIFNLPEDIQRLKILGKATYPWHR